MTANTFLGTLLCSGVMALPYSCMGMMYAKLKGISARSMEGPIRSVHVGEVAKTVIRAASSSRGELRAASVGGVENQRGIEHRQTRPRRLLQYGNEEVKRKTRQQGNLCYCTQWAHEKKTPNMYHYIAGTTTCSACAPTTLPFITVRGHTMVRFQPRD